MTQWIVWLSRGGASIDFYLSIWTRTDIKEAAIDQGRALAAHLKCRFIDIERAP